MKKSVTDPRSARTPFISYVAALLSIVAIGLVGWNSLRSNGNLKIGFVRSNDLINGYLGTKECQRVLEGTTQQLKANIDTLSLAHQQSINGYRTEQDQLTLGEREARQRTLGQQEQQIAQYAANAQQHAKEEETKLMQGVLNQINSFVETYGRDKGYDVILGTTASGSLLYAQKSNDITDEVLRELNKSYSKTATAEPKQSGN